jgi:hypothetical protein
MARTRKPDSVEAVVRKADETLEEWIRRGARVLRNQVNGLQAGLRKVGSGLEQLETDRTAAPEVKRAARKPRRRSTVARKPARSRKSKKAA